MQKVVSIRHRYAARVMNVCLLLLMMIVITP